MYFKDTTMILNRSELDLLAKLLEDYQRKERPLPLGKVLLNRIRHAQKMTGYVHLDVDS